MKNLAGHNVSIFLFRFVPRQNAISFVLNEGIAEDLYPQTEAQLQPLVHACCETLSRYKELCHTSAIMDGNILWDGCFEVMLSPGLGKHFPEREKQNLFNDAHKISELLQDVMERRSKEIEEGSFPGPQTVIPQIGQTGLISEGFEALGKERHREAMFAREGSSRPGLKQLTPEDLPAGVVAIASYDHRGHCLAFNHKSLGQLGKIVFSPMGSETWMETELYTGNSQNLSEKKALLEEIVAVIEAGFTNIPAG